MKKPCKSKKRAPDGDSGKGERTGNPMFGLSENGEVLTVVSKSPGVVMAVGESGQPENLFTLSDTVAVKPDEDGSLQTVFLLDP